MAETRWTYARGWLIASILSNLTSTVLGFSTDWIGEPAWLGPVLLALLVVALVCIAVFFVKIVRWRAPQDAGTEHLGQ
jgi:hypothetical protein